MSSSALRKAIDSVLAEPGFRGKRSVWNRRSDSWIDAVDLQVAKSSETLTVNVGVMDVEVYRLLWGRAPGELVEVPECTIQARPRGSAAGNHRWWPVNSPDLEQAITHELREQLLPLIERLHAREEMEQFLEATDVLRRRVPLEVLNLAILKHLLGKRDEALGLLDGLQEKRIGNWHSRTQEVLNRLKER